jgi:hypothetical protein
MGAKRSAEDQASGEYTEAAKHYSSMLGQQPYKQQNGTQC